ncbi:hypothetical protein Pst134EA_030252 [Puccinia striiformis f. sp. tritici]|uniref:hypothetical protein n=1 Tax=Puccinia striiformis f. sp. tritici TaxID=168172 RepID=UPI002007DEAD|nr:hypothetical protein Pst134EA_030252 [Puccinia striiformis f. sp. tritici]KAH9446331.1 hypothetical protein Pst134EA_030252 [Puccinia striiformis f. sp. tritici]
MAKKTSSKDPRPTLAQRLRRSQNAAINLSAWARLLSNQPTRLSDDVGLSDHTNNFEVHDVDMANNPYDPHQQNQDIGDSSDEGEEEPARWITLATDADDQADGLDPSFHSAQEEYRQLMKEYNWSCLLRSLHTWYMTLKLHTNNWADSNALEEFKSSDCKCPPSKTKSRYVDLIDLHGIQPFTIALTEYLEPRSERLFVANANHARDVRKPFSAAVDMYRRLEEMSDDVIDSALQQTDQNILAGRSCPACFGPEPANSSVYPAATRNQLCVCLDGNFQHRHHSKASKDHGNLRIPQIFLPEGAVEAMTAGIRHMELIKKPPSQADRCADAHKAADDKRNTSTWKGCDDTGLMGCCCRHDSAISLTNIYKSGEQRAMPLALLRKLLGSVEVNRPVGVLYDIGCSLDKYIKVRGLLPEFTNQMMFGTSIFHSYVHNWMCQLDYNPRLNTGWGLSDGEGLERMWSYLSPLVSPLRYATCNHRLAAIAHRLKYHNTRGIKQLPQWLSKKFKIATRRHWETHAQLDWLLSKQNPFKPPGRNYQVSYFQKQWNHQRTFRADHTDKEQDRRNKLIKIYEHRATIDKLRQKLLDPKLALLPVKAMKKIIKSIKQRSQQLKKDAEGISDLPRMKKTVCL